MESPFVLCTVIATPFKFNISYINLNSVSFIFPQSICFVPKNYTIKTNFDYTVHFVFNPHSTNNTDLTILSYDAYQNMGLQDKDLLSTSSHVYGFTGDVARVKGMVKLPITLGEEPQIATQIHEFTLVDHNVGYNVIIGIPIMKGMRMVLSIYHLTVKFPTPHGIGKIRECQYDSRDCYNKDLKFAEKKSQHLPGHNMNMITIDNDGRARKGNGSNQQGGGMCNMISIK